jgi:hypothetical protein
MVSIWTPNILLALIVTSSVKLAQYFPITVIFVEETVFLTIKQVKIVSVQVVFMMTLFQKIANPVLLIATPV